MRTVRDSDIFKKNMTIDAFAKACDRWNSMPKDNPDKVFTKSPEKTLCGFAAEELILSLMPTMIPSTGDDVYDYDYIFFNRKIDIKNKCGTIAPRSNYEGSIYLYPNKHIPECDFFLFTRMIEMDKTKILPKGFSLKDLIGEDLKNQIAPLLLEKYPYLWFCGCISRQEFLSPGVAFIVREGDLLEGTTKKADGNTINVKYNKCHPVKPLLDHYEANNV